MQQGVSASDYQNMRIKSKSGETGFLPTKELLCSKGNNERKRKSSEWEKIFESYISDKELYSETTQ